MVVKNKKNKSNDSEEDLAFIGYRSSDLFDNRVLKYDSSLNMSPRRDWIDT